MKLFKFSFLMIFAYIVIPVNAESIAINKNNYKYEVNAQFETFADVCSTWYQITDYKNLPSFLPNLITSEILRNSGNKKVIRQVYLERILLFQFQLESQFFITEQFSKKKIKVQQITGDLKDYNAVWELIQKKEKTVINLSASITPTQFQMLLLPKEKIVNRFKIMIDALVMKLNSIDTNNEC